MKWKGRLDLHALSPARSILAGGAGLLFVDSFLPWQRSCIFLAADFPLACSRANAWAGNGFFAGSVMAILALGLLGATAAPAAGFEPPDERVPRLIPGLLIGTVVFGAIKFLYAAAKHPALGAWLGLGLFGALLYGGFVKVREDNRIPGR
jgi:hypothetical protein